MHCNYTSRGQVAVELIFLAAIVVTIIAGFVSLAASFLQISLRAQNDEQALAIAEAGINYYEWHLAYAPEDFEDGTGHAGPYVHNYYNKNGTEIGQFTLTITPPPAGSTIVNITSVGTVLADSSVKKSIEVELGIPSFAQYAWAMNSSSTFGSTAQVYGPIYSNNGVHFITGAVAHNLVASALTTYVNGGATEWAVYTDTDPRPPTALPTSTSNTFLAGREVGEPALNFTEITQDLATIKSGAQASGTYFASSSARGYDLALQSTTYALYKVTATSSAPNGCTNSDNQSGWDPWSIKTEMLYATGTIPEDGNLFFEDNVWVRGQVNNKRVTIASGRFPVNASTYSNIIVNSSTIYTNFNGSDTIALISQGNVIVGLNSDNNLTIDAALVAQNGMIGRYDYANCGSNATRNSLTTDGILVTNGQSGFQYTYGSPYQSYDNGYSTRTYNYDANLLYAPPPSFPLTTDSYSLILWKELL